MSLRHKDYVRVKAWVTSRDTNGFPIPVWTYGPPGLGKTHLAEQIAVDLGVPFIPTAWGPTSTDTRVVGFLSAGQGTYIPGPAYEWFRNGGLWFMDELDNAEPSALVSINSLLANARFRFPNGDLATKHKDCYALAGANTLGTGAQQGFRRQSQDAAARSRWAKVKIGFDEALEAALAPNQRWVDYVKRVRSSVERLAKTQIWITPRDSIIGSAALANGISDADVMEHLFAEFSPEARAQVQKEVGLFRSMPEPPPPQPKREWKPPTDWTSQAAVADLTSAPTWTEQKPYRPTKKYREYE